MAITIGKKNTRTVKVDAKEPGESNASTNHTLSIEIEIMPREDWDTMTKRWSYLGDLMHQRKVAADLGKDLPDITDDEINESRKPIYKFAVPFIKNIGPFQDDSGNPIVFSDAVLDAVLEIPWLYEPIEAAFMAVQQGITVAKYRENRSKN